MASRMAARSTMQGTPVKSCMMTRAGVNAISWLGSAFGSHFEQRFDVALGDIDAVFEAQQIFQQDLQGEGQTIDIVRLECREIQNLILLRAHLERRSCIEAICHDPSTEKREL